MSIRMILCLLILIIDTFVAYGQTVQVFPQFANGRIQDGSLRTSFLLTNNNNSTITGSIQLKRSDGAELIIGFTNGQRGSRIQFSLPPGGMDLIESDGEGNLAAGFALIYSSGPVSASLIFSQLDSDGTPIIETGVCSPMAMDSFTIPVDTTQGFNTGVAIANASNHTANLSLRLIGLTGAQVGDTLNLTLEPNRHISRFVSELFPGIPSMRGSMAVISNTEVFAAALRVSSRTLTAFPISRGAFQAEFAIESGHYTGSTENGGTITFDVMNGNTVQNLRVDSPALSLESGDRIHIMNNRFSFAFGIPFARLTFSGTFTSPNSASGTIVFDRESTTERINWSAGRRN